MNESFLITRWDLGAAYVVGCVVISFGTRQAGRKGPKLQRGEGEGERARSPSTHSASKRNSDHLVMEIVTVSILCVLSSRDGDRRQTLSRLDRREKPRMGRKEGISFELELAEARKERTHELHDHDIPFFNVLASREHGIRRRR